MRKGDAKHHDTRYLILDTRYANQITRVLVGGRPAKQKISDKTGVSSLLFLMFCYSDTLPTDHLIR